MLITFFHFIYILVYILAVVLIMNDNPNNPNRYTIGDVIPLQVLRNKVSKITLHLEIESEESPAKIRELRRLAEVITIPTTLSNIRLPLSQATPVASVVSSSTPLSSTDAKTNSNITSSSSSSYSETGNNDNEAKGGFEEMAAAQGSVNNQESSISEFNTTSQGQGQSQGDRRGEVSTDSSDSIKNAKHTENTVAATQKESQHKNININPFHHNRAGSVPKVALPVSKVVKTRLSFFLSLYLYI